MVATEGRSITAATAASNSTAKVPQTATRTSSAIAVATASYTSVASKHRKAQALTKQWRRQAVADRQTLVQESFHLASIQGSEALHQLAVTR